MKQPTSQRRAVQPPDFDPDVTSPGIPLDQLERPPSGSRHKPYRFSRLPKVSRAQVLLTERIEWLMPAAGGDHDTAQAVSARMKDLLDEEVRLQLDHIQVVPPVHLRKIAAEPTFLAVLSPAPQRTRGLLEIDLGLCHASIDKLLGGAGDATGLRPLTDIEEGVMGFIILEALKTLAPNLDQGLPRPRLEGCAHSVDEAVALLGEEQQVVVVQLKATLGPQAGFLRLFIPASVVGMTNPPGEGPERRARRLVDVERNLGRLKAVKTWLVAEIGQAEISSRDLRGVRTGDVVLVDELTVRHDKGEGGNARLRVGTGRAGRLLAEISLEDGHYKAKISGYQAGEEPKVAPEAQEANTNPGASEGNADVSESAQGEGSDLLNDIPLQIAVELARVPVTAEQVVALKTGQVLDLNKVPGEPVEMSVNGKVVARGEIVEIEGHLGVRILSLVG